MARGRELTVAEMNSCIDAMMDPKVSNEELYARMGAALRIMSGDRRARISRQEAQHRNAVASAKSSGDMAALRKLANANLTRKR